MVIHLALCEFDVFVLSIYSSIAEEEKTFIKQNVQPNVTFLALARDGNSSHL